MGAVFALLGAGMGVGVLVALSRPRPRLRTGRRWGSGLPAVRVAAVLAAAAVTGAVTRWPVGAVLAGAAVWALPALLGADRAQARRLERLDAIAAWAEDLAGTLRAADGVEQAVLHTAATAPGALREPLAGLAQALRGGVRLPAALRAFAAEVADPTCDLVVTVLVLASQYQAREVAAALSGIGRTARRHAAGRLRVAVGRARVRTQTRIVVGVILATTVGVVVGLPGVVRPYATPLGQLVLAALGAGFCGVLVWMGRASRIPDLPRILAPAGDDQAVG